MSKVGLARQAYKGSPKGIRSVWPEDLDMRPLPKWYWVKGNNQHKLTTIRSAAYTRKLQTLIDSI